MGSLRAALYAVLLATVLATACGGSQQENDRTSDTSQPGLVVLGEQQDLVVFSVARDLALGPNRVPINLLRIDQTVITDRASDLSIEYGPLNEEATRQADAIRWRPWPHHRGVYTFQAQFDRTGIWEIHVTLQEPEETISGKVAIQVKDTPQTPAVGSPAPRTPTKTAYTVEEARNISSDPEPNPALYQLSLHEAMDSGIPVVVTFATPAFCHTHTCGPQLEVFKELRHDYTGLAHFMHVEIWDNPREMLETGDRGTGIVSPAVAQWNLSTEPWTFLIDPDGLIAARFEGYATSEELADSIEAALAGRPWTPG